MDKTEKTPVKVEEEEISQLKSDAEIASTEEESAPPVPRKHTFEGFAVISTKNPDQGVSEFVDRGITIAPISDGGLIVHTDEDYARTIEAMYLDVEIRKVSVEITVN